MALADRGRRNGWHHQATSLVSSHSALGTTAKALVDRSGPLLRRRPLLEAQDQEVDSASEEIGIELARKLDEARAEIARLELRLSHDAAAAQELRAQIKASAAATEAADQRAAGLAREIAAARGGLQENIDLLTAENARPDWMERQPRRASPLPTSPPTVRTRRRARTGPSWRAC